MSEDPSGYKSSPTRAISHLSVPITCLNGCQNRLELVPHGDGHALMFGRCEHRHGFNLGQVEEVAANAETVLLEHATEVKTMRAMMADLFSIAFPENPTVKSTAGEAIAREGCRCEKYAGERDRCQFKPLCDELTKLTGWVRDLQSGMYINCVYCGHRYGPSDKVPASMADVLKAHIAECPKHPMSELVAALRVAKETIHTWHGDLAWDIYDRNSPEMMTINKALALVQVPVSNQPSAEVPDAADD